MSAGPSSGGGVVTTGTDAAIVRADATHLPFGDETIDCIVTSPPYFALRSYQDGGEHFDGQIGSEPTPTAFLEALWAVTAECWRVLKPTGSLFVNLGDKYAGSGGHNNGGIAKPDKKRKGWAEGNNPMSTQANATRRTAPDHYNQSSDVRSKSLMGLPWRYAIGCTDGEADPDGRGWILRQELVWSKPNGMPESVTDRGRRSHEQFFHFTKNGAYWADVNPLRVPHAQVSIDRSGRARFAEDRSQDGVGGPNTLDPEQACHPLGKLPDSVWSIPTQPLIVPDHLGVDHFAAFPTEWPRRLISAWCPPGGVVLDPFGGTGTTAMVARALGRFGVSMDLSADYLRLQQWRIFESDGPERVARRSAEQTSDPNAAEAMFDRAAVLAGGPPSLFTDTNKNDDPS